MTIPMSASSSVTVKPLLWMPYIEAANMKQWRAIVGDTCVYQLWWHDWKAAPQWRLIRLNAWRDTSHVSRQEAVDIAQAEWEAFIREAIAL